MMPAVLAAQDRAAEAVAAPAPIRAQDGKVLLRMADLRAVGERAVARVEVPLSDLPVLGTSPAQDSPAHGLLRDLVAAGQAAGNLGDLYDNRDRGHSRLSPEAHPQLTHIQYDAELRAADADYGAAGPILFEAPVIGNSSTAVAAGPFWRSLPRLVLASPIGPRWLYQNYLAGQIHVYPCHRDHDPGTGDLIPANTPLLLISRGSSRSDQPHLQALAMILAAFPADTKAMLLRSGRLSASVQAIFRQGFAQGARRDLFRTGAAHPSVFSAREMDLLAMVRMAQGLAPDTVPPRIALRMVSEDLGRPGIDLFGEGLSEALFDTPAAIARIWRSGHARREMVVAAQAEDAPAGAMFDWHLLRGDRTRVRIEPLDSHGSRARLTLDWQNPMPVAGERNLVSSRIDIGVFLRRDGMQAMPGLISVLLPHHETRRYGAGPDGQLRLESRDFRLRADGYADPVLFPRMAWRDVYTYDAAGQMQGWVRESAQGQARFDAQGRYLSQTGPVTVRYPVGADAQAVPEMQWQPAG